MMSIVDLASTIFGLLIIISRGPLVIAPGASLNVFMRMIGTNTRTRIFGLCLLPLGALLIWVGNAEYGDLAAVLMVIGWIIGGGAMVMLIFPQAYMALAESIVPEDVAGDLYGWRVLGAIGVLIGCVFVYFGLLAE
jgi:hypothetical protein